MIYDIAIIGGGPAGLSASIYAMRAGMNTVMFEGTGCGGQINYTPDVDNYPGVPQVSGSALAEAMRRQAEYFGTEFKAENVREIKDSSRPIKKLVTRKNIYQARTVILATGAKPKKLGILGEDDFIGAGVSYCAACDGAFAKGKTATVIGGGNTAFEDALYLSSLCNKVYIINRSSKFRAAKLLVDKAYSTPKIEILTDFKTTKIQGNERVTSLILAHSISGRISVLDTDAVFVAIGRIPESKLYDGLSKFAPDGSIISDENLCVGTDGLFVAGDVRNTPLRQIITAAADGAVAATSAVNYINSL